MIKTIFAAIDKRPNGYYFVDTCEQEDDRLCVRGYRFKTETEAEEFITAIQPEYRRNA